MYDLFMGVATDIAEAAARIRESESVTVVSHIDADGIASSSIMQMALAREQIPAVPVFVRQLEPLTMKHIPRDGSLKLFTDLGSGQQNLLEEAGFSDSEVVILDHHIPQPGPANTPYFQVNSQFYGDDYAKCSAAGICYLVARTLNASNTDLTKLAVVGNVGDMMAREHGKLTGVAHRIAEDGQQCGQVRIGYGPSCYGVSTRALHQSLSNCDDPIIPGISGNAPAAVAFLMRIGIYSSESSSRTFEELNADEIRMLSSALAEQMMANGEAVDRLFAEHYFFPTEQEKTPLRNASEYATMLNACGRWQKPAVGAAVCAGDRGVHYREAEHMLRHHRSIIRELCEYILDTGVTEHSSIQSINTGDKYPDTVVGIGAGMALSKLNPAKPILVICTVSDEPDLLKISMRTNERCVRRGVNLQEALCKAAAEFGGGGGGHNIAAGAYIPKGCEDDFTRRVNQLIEEQFGSGTAHS